MSSSPLPTLILYGSQTGNAQEIAKQLHSDVTTKFNQLHTRCMSMQDYIEKYKDVTDLPNERLLIIVMSTTGQGDAPDNAQRFLRFFRKQKSSTWLNNTYFAVLGLGDTNYDKFCEPAKRMDKDLAAVGGQRLLEKALADDGVGLELVIEPWRKKFFDAINTFITTANTTSTTTTTATPTTSTSVATQFLDKFHTGTSTEMEKKQETPVAAATTPATTTASVTAPATPSTVPTSATSASTITTPASPAESASVPASTSTPTSTSTSAATSVSTSASASTTTTTPSSSSTSTPVDHTVCSCHPRPSSSIISTSAPLPTLILYGSQTGNAQEIAKTLYSDVNAKFANLHTRCMSMQDYIEKYKDVTDLPNERLLIIVMSTTGQGDAPDNAQRFLRFFRKQKSPTWLSNTHFAVLGLGDTNYDKFCEPAKRMDKDLAAVGGQRLLDKALADDGVGLELVVEPWRKKFFDAINKFIATSAATSASTSTSTSTTTTTTATSSAAQISDKSHTTSTETEKKQDTATTASTSSAPSSSSSSSSSSSTTEIIPSSTSTITAAPATSTPIPATTAATTTSTTTSTTTTTSTSTTPTASSSTVTSTPLAPLSTDHIVKSLSQATLYPRPQPLTAATASTALTVPHEKPKGLPPLRSCHVHLQYHTTDLPYDPATYVMSRFKKWDTDAVLKGYTSEAPLMATLGRASWLTTSSSIDRHVLHLELDLPPHGKDNILYNVGDAVGIYCPNSSQLVDSLIERLGLVGTDIITLAESDDKDRNTLAHISTPCTIRDALLYCCDIQDIPRKALLRVLYEYCHDIHDKQRLAKLMGPMGYVKLMAPAVRPTLLDLLYQYPSCRPPLDHLLDQLPPLKPRFYSVASSPDQYPTSLHVAFTLVEWEARIPDPTSTDWDASHPYTISRKGLCTSWLYEACRVGGLLKGEDVTRAVYRSEEIKQKGDADGHHGVTPAPTSISSTIAGVHRSPTGTLSIPIFMRRTLSFSPPSDLSLPIIMIGPGTGVAPYRGFLQHRQVQRHALESGGTCMGWWRGLEVEIEEKKDKSSSNPAFISRTWTTRPTPTASRGHYDDMDDDIDPDAQAAREKSHVGPMTLFFGCRHRDQDYLYRDEWQQFLTDGTLTELHVAFSREQAHKVYVQELIRQQGAKLAKQIVHEKGHVYVCGDGTRMATDVMAAIESILCHHASMSATDAKAYVQTMMKESRYLQDIWS